MERDNLFDNVKGLLIFLVTLGHFIQIGLRDSVPLFLCMVKSALGGKLVFCSIWFPPFGMWFLLSLFLLNLILPWAAGIRKSLSLSVLAALLIGCEGRIGSFLALSRTICLLPFFLLGALYVSGEKIDKLRKMCGGKKLCLAAVWAAVCITFLFVMHKSGMNYQILWLKNGYHRAGMTVVGGMAARLFFFVSAFCTGVVIFMTMTKRKCFLSQWGKNSLSVYLFHLAAFYPVKILLKHWMPYENPWAAGGAVIALSLGAVWLSSRNFVNNALKKLIGCIEKFTWKGI